jgi:spermidine/putrescine transport system substrate-binding protein
MSDLERPRPTALAMSRRTLLRGAAGASAAAALGSIAASCGASATPAPTIAPTSAPAPAMTQGGSGATPTATMTTAPAPTPQPTPEGELNIYNWADYIGDTTIADFESKYNIKVTYDFFDTTDTQTAKISTGNSGYDVTFPTSTYIKGLVERKLVQPLDLSLVPNLVNLAPEWQNPSYDPGNAHSVPYFWWTTGVAYLADKVKTTLTSWDALWDPTWKGHMAMLDDYRECFSAALIKLGYDINTIDTGHLDEALALLQQQKSLLRTYTTDDIGVLSTGDVWVMHAWGADVYQVKADNPNSSVTYYLPQEGAVRGSDTMVLLAGAKHPIAAHLFINYMLDPQVSANNTNYTGYMGPNQAAKQYIDPSIVNDPGVNPPAELIAKLQEIQDLGANENLYSERWTKLRAGA